MRNAMTVDVEDWFHVAALAPYVPRAKWDRCECRVERNTRRLLALCELQRLRATFFVLGWVAERYPALVREIAAHGHEVACHGQSHQLVYCQTPDEFREETRRAKRTLEDIVQQPVTGYRAASYSITRRSLWALDVLTEEGFLWDSSIFPIYHDRYGMPDAPRWPYRLTAPNGAELAEFPLTTVQLGRYRLPIAGGGYFRIFPYRLTQWGLRRVNRVEQRPFIFYLHPWEIDPGQPRVKASMAARFRHYTHLDRCERRLERLLGNFRFTAAGDVLAELGLLAQPQDAAPARAMVGD